MPETKYKFNHETLQYEKVKISKIKKIIRIIVTQIVTAIVFAFFIFLFTSYFIETPKKRKLKYEHAILEKQYIELDARQKQIEMLHKELKERDRSIYRFLFEAEPDTEDEGEENSGQKYIGRNILSNIDENENKLVDLSKSIDIQKKEFLEILKLLKIEEDNLRYIPAIQPLWNNDLKYSVYGFGIRIDPVYKSKKMHDGIDYAAPLQTNVFATADGKVVEADESKRGMGKRIKISHLNGYETVYAHLDEMKVRPGEKVERGKVIGVVGNTGKSFIPHLHYEIIFKGKNVNPTLYFVLDLSAEKYREINQAASKAGLCLD